MSGQRREPTQEDARSIARWENEGGASKREPTVETLKGLEIPAPKRKDVLDALRTAPPRAEDPLERY